MASSDYGIKTSGDDLNWKNLNNDHADDPVVTALVKESDNIFSGEEIKDDTIILSNELLIEFSKFLLDNKLGSYFENSSKDDNKKDTKDSKKNKKEEKEQKKKQKVNVKKADIMKQNIEKDKNKKEILKFLNNLDLDKHYPFKKNKLHESFLNIIYWVCYLIKKYKKDDTITTEILCDASISLFRAINDCQHIINVETKDICYEILNKLESCILKKNKNYVYDLLSKYYYLITQSKWDKDKPNNIKLYNEQKQTIQYIYDSIVENKPLFLFYWVPPANGKTLVSVIIAKTISNYYRGLHKNKLEFFNATINKTYDDENGPFEIKYDDGEIQDDITINMIRPLNSHKLRNTNIEYTIGQKVEAQKFVEPKILLYICYNDIVRNSVSSLCVTHNVDIKFWIATYRQDKYKSDVFFVDFRPYKNCYPDWRKKKSQKLFKKDERTAEKRFSPDLREQMLQYLDETRMIDIREKEVEHHIVFNEENTVERCKNLPEMIISDLDSAYELLKEFPNLFVPYFDEAFAASNQMITSKIMSVLPKTSILVSATLATHDKIPTILNTFKRNHDATDENIKTIRTGSQHINCEFISPDGDLISPFHNLENSSQIDSFINLMERNPIIERGFSNLIVLKMFEQLKDDLPEGDNLLFVENLGNITNSNIREYGKKLLKLCSNNDILFDKIKKIKISKINDNIIENIFTKNAHIYNEKNTLHVSNPEHFSSYVSDITSEFLKGSPVLKKLISEYKKIKENIEKEIEDIKKNVKDDTNGIKSYKLDEANKKLEEIKFKYPNEFIVNSQNHFKKYNKSGVLSTPQSILFNSDVINNFNDMMCKLYLSNIGVYNQSDLNSYELEIFLKYKDRFKFIISDPSIIYGTNINLTMIDIHENLAPISTRNTIYQLMGRGGRFGKSSSAVVNFRCWRLFDIVVNDNDINEEATNIENNLIEFLK